MRSAILILTVLTTRPVLHACMLSAPCLLTRCTDLTSSVCHGQRPTDAAPAETEAVLWPWVRASPPRATGVRARWHVRRVTQGDERCRLLSDADAFAAAASHDLTPELRSAFRTF